VVGLVNLGNTCFMNSILQCLAAVEPLTSFFLAKNSFKELQTDNPLGSGGRLTLAWATLLRAMRSPTTSTLSPLLVKEYVTEKAPMFAGWQQHDSKEFAEYMLATLNEDCLRSFPKAVYEAPVDGSRQRPDAEVAEETWRRNLLREDGIVTDVFGGLLHSLLECQVCKTTSLKCDPFTSLALAMPSFSHAKVAVRAGGREKLGGVAGFPLTHLQLRVSKVPDGSSEQEAEPVGYGGYYSAYGQPKKVAPPQTKVTVAEAALWLSTYVDNPRQTPVLTPAMVSQAAADPEGTYKASGFVAGRVINKDGSISKLCWAAELRPTDNAEETAQGGSSISFFPIGKGASTFIPCNFRVRCDLDNSGKEDFKLEPGNVLRRSVPFYDPTVISLCASTTCADVREQVWVQMLRFMDPAWVSEKGYNAENPPYKLSRVAPLAFADGRDPLENAARAKYELLPHTQEPFGDDVASASLLVEITVPKQQDLCHIGQYMAKPGAKLAWEMSQDHPAQAANPVPPVSLETLLELNECKETLKGWDEVYCSACKQLRPFTKALRLWRLPPILSITLKRFKFTESAWGMQTTKNEDPIKYPVQGLDMSPFLAGPKVQAVKPVAFSPGAAPQDALPPIYDLIAVSNHMGGYGGGHYNASVQNFATGEWHCADG
jgi:ubiquitin C-terminal hydrolase